MEDQWFVQGSLNMNRAVHGDVVVAQLLPESEWTAPEKTIRLRDAEETQNEGDNLPDADGEEEDDQEEDLEDSEAPEMKGKKGFTLSTYCRHFTMKLASLLLNYFASKYAWCSSIFICSF
ncbi:unnamed protein product [Meloidogyne enterolobii]|uniref:Uncharacterized protein n=1 Tax=Meloidogyne enterolobii TaxID=390850 RepID=A0ACB1ALY6_MELEN